MKLLNVKPVATVSPNNYSWSLFIPAGSEMVTLEVHPTLNLTELSVCQDRSFFCASIWKV